MKEEVRFSEEFSKMTKEQLEQVIRDVANQDMDADRLLSRAIRKVVKPDSFIDDVSEAYSDLCRKFLEVKLDIENNSYDSDNADYEMFGYICAMKEILEYFIPKFISKKMFLEGIRFVIAVVNSLDLHSSSTLFDLCCDVEFDGTPYYDELIKAGKLDIEEVKSLRNEYEHHYEKLIDVFAVADKIPQ